MTRLRSFLMEQGLSLAWVIATVSTAGSLYFSEVLEYIPCTLCWYQRILMYPLVILLGIASVRKDFRQIVYVLPMTIIGIGFSSYHYSLEKTDWFDQGGNTCGIIPCTTEYINWFGFITIPFLALTAFTLITLLLLPIHFMKK